MSLPPGLEGSRIHPEYYEQAKKIGWHEGWEAYESDEASELVMRNSLDECIL